MSDVLIVEDNVLFRETLARILIKRLPSITIVEAADGKAAFSAIRRKMPQLILMDIGLPGENGIQLTKEISQVYPEIAIIVITNYDTREFEKAALNAGATVFMSKDSSTAVDIVDKVRETLI